ATVSGAVDMKSSKKVALSGIFSALCVIFLFIGSVFQTLDLSAAAMASIVILVSFIELGKKWACGVYAVASILALLLLPYKTAAAVFALFAGFYPIIKEYLNKIRPFWLSVIARVVCFNIFLTLLIFVSYRFFGIEEDFLGFNIVLYLLANVTFVLYDFALERIAVYYIKRIKPKIFK
ncbi:MAG: hypothetical protein IJC20_02950, partial [Clostridia bacterium]|nr:hypothetical protein [Clostridia bacterium]